MKEMFSVIYYFRQKDHVFFFENRALYEKKGKKKKKKEKNTFLRFHFHIGKGESGTMLRHTYIAYLVIFNTLTHKCFFPHTHFIWRF